MTIFVFSCLARALGMPQALVSEGIVPFRVVPSAVWPNTLVHHAVVLLAILRYRLRPHAVNFPVNLSVNLSVSLLLSRCECVYDNIFV